MTARTSDRPGLVTFAALVMFIIGGFSVVTAIEEFSNSAWLNEITSGLFGRQFIVWAIIDLVLAAVAIFAGWDIWRGGTLGRWIGLFFAVFSSARWFFLIFWVPLPAFIVITLNVIIIYSLTSNSDYFEQ